MEDYTTSRQPEVDIAFINAKTRLAITLAFGGMLALIVGLIVILVGSSGDNNAIFKLAKIEISASGMGAVIMATSVLWAYIAYKVRPKYSASQRIVKKVSADGSEELQHEMESTLIRPADKLK